MLTFHKILMRQLIIKNSGFIYETLMKEIFEYELMAKNWNIVCVCVCVCVCVRELVLYYMHINCIRI